MFKRFARPATLFAALLLTAAAYAQEDPAPAPVPPAATTEIVLETTLGDIVVALETEKAPVTAGNFLRYVDEHRLDGTVFYRAMKLDWGDQPNGLIQGGTQFDPERILPPIAHEPTSETGLSHKRGSLSMARYEPGSATGDFSIFLQDQPGMDADLANADSELRKRLMISGDLSTTAGISDSFDTYVDAAVKRFQARHGLPDDGVLGKHSYSAMNVSAEVRLGQLETNLVRLRELLVLVALHLPGCHCVVPFI